ncbi:MAG: hypothetical protein NC078_12900, partial [Ruminococcus sp.]|nr:hypothetical protein [Ruminococcus sp.]
EAGKALAEMQRTFEHQGGFADLFTGKNDWETVGKGMASFGRTLLNFGKEVSGTWDDEGSEVLDPKGIEHYAASIKIAAGLASDLAQMQSEFGNVGGWLGTWVGDNDWTSIGRGMEFFGGALMGFGETIHGISEYEEDYSKCVGIGKSLAGLQSSFGNTGGFAADVLGDNSWVDIGRGLADFGRSLMTFGVICHSITDKKYNVHMSVVIALMHELADILCQSQSVTAASYMPAWSNLTIGLTDLGEELYDFGATANLTVQNAEAMSKIIKIIGELAECFKKTAGIQEEWVADFGTAAVELGVCLSEFWNSIRSIDKSKLAVVVTQLKHLQEFIKETAGLNISGLTNFRTALQAVADMGIDSFTDAFDNSAYKVQNATGGILTKVTDRLKEGREELKQAAVYTVEGFTEGLESGDYSVRIASERLANAVIDSIRDTLGIHSPAWETFLLGQYTEQGWSGGLLSGLANAFGAGEDLGSAGLSGLLSGAKDGLADVKDWASNALNGGILSGTDVLSGLFPDGESDLTAGLEDLGLDGVSDWFTDMFSDPSAKIAELQSDIEKTEAQLAKAKENYGEDSSRVKELEEKLASLNDELTRYQGLTSALGDSFDLDEFLKGLSTDGVGALDGVLTESFLSNLTPEETSKLTGKLNDAVSDQVTNAKKEYDSLFEAYKEGTVSRADYEKRYTEILSKYTLAQTDTVKYAADKMTEYADDKLEDLTKDYEDKIKDIQQDIDNFTEGHTTSYESSLEFTTNKDVYDKTVEDYENKISDLNEQMEKAKETYGENSDVVSYYQQQIDRLTEAMEKYKKAYEDSGKADDEIVSVDMGKELDRNTKELTEFLEGMKKLNTKGISDELRQEIAGMEQDKAIAAVNYLNSLSDSELKALDDRKKKEKEIAEELAQELYGDKIQTETDSYVQNVNDLLSSLPESAVQIGYDTAMSYVDGFSEGTSDALTGMGIAADSIKSAIVAPEIAAAMGNITGLTKEGIAKIGENFGDILVSGFSEKVAGNADGAANSIAGALKAAAESNGAKKTYQ